MSDEKLAHEDEIVSEDDGYFEVLLDKTKKHKNTIVYYDKQIMLLQQEKYILEMCVILNDQSNNSNDAVYNRLEAERIIKWVTENKKQSINTFYL